MSLDGVRADRVDLGVEIARGHPAISYPRRAGRRAANAEPLLINTTGSLDDQPNAQTQLPNLFLASDYVRTNIALATMEGANEAAREAAGALLARSGSNAAPPSIGTLWQPSQLDPLFALDAQRYRAALPNLLDTNPASVPL